MSLCWVSQFIYCYAKCHYAECRYAECRGAGILSHPSSICLSWMAIEAKNHKPSLIIFKKRVGLYSKICLMTWHLANPISSTNLSSKFAWKTARFLIKFSKLWVWSNLDMSLRNSVHSDFDVSNDDKKVVFLVFMHLYTLDFCGRLFFWRFDTRPTVTAPNF